MSLRLLDDAAVTALEDQTHETLTRVIEVWPRDQEFDVFDALVQVYGRAVLAWAGVDVHGREATRISADLAAVVDGFGAQGRAYPRAWLARWRLDRWASRLVRKERSGRIAPDGSVLAVAYLGAVAVGALDDHPEWRQELARPSAVAERIAFVQRLVRVFPFVPALAGKARRDAVIGGSRVSEGERIVLDVPGTNRDAATWGDASHFNPGGSGGWSVGDFDMVPQGGGRPASGHRCPGELLAIAVLDTTVQVFAGLPWQLRDGRPVSTRRIPIRPDVRLRQCRAWSVPGMIRPPGVGPHAAAAIGYDLVLRPARGKHMSYDRDQLQPNETLDDRGVDDVLDEGMSPPERLRGSTAKGTTPAEAREGETIEDRLRQEEPELDIEPPPPSEHEPPGDEVGDRRSGRLVAPDEGAHDDVVPQMVGRDVGIDGAGAAAEEAAVHEVPDEPEDEAGG
jgi:fatty-acid peroxygenase